MALRTPAAIASAACVALGLAASPAAAQTSLPAYRPGMTAAEFAAAERAQELRDQADCTEEGVRNGKVTPVFTSVGGGSLAGAVIGGVIVGAVAGLAEVNRTASGTRACMAELGYSSLELTPAQTAEVHALRSSGERTAWYAKTPLFAPRRASTAYALLMWDPEMSRPVRVQRDPSTGELSRTWTMNR